MSKKEKKSFETNSPEWQLHQNMMSAKLLVGTHTADSERSLVKAEEARTKYERYKEALMTLQPGFIEEEYE